MGFSLFGGSIGGNAVEVGRRVVPNIPDAISRWTREVVLGWRLPMFTIPITCHAMTCHAERTHENQNNISMYFISDF